MRRATIISASLRRSVRARVRLSGKTLRANCMVMVLEPSRSENVRKSRQMAPATRRQSIPEWS